MRQIVYFSTAAAHQDRPTIGAILAVSRDNNANENITGLLVAGGHRYLQLIEGPAGAVNALMERIRRDQRHVGVTVLVNRKIAKRMFADWSMAYFEEPQLGDYETFRQLIDRVRAETPGRHLREQIDCFERLYAAGEPAPAPSPWTLATSYTPRLALDGGH